MDCSIFHWRLKALYWNANFKRLIARLMLERRTCRLWKGLKRQIVFSVEHLNRTMLTGVVCPVLWLFPVLRIIRMPCWGQEASQVVIILLEECLAQPYGRLYFITHLLLFLQKEKENLNASFFKSLFIVVEIIKDTSFLRGSQGSTNGDHIICRNFTA